LEQRVGLGTRRGQSLSAASMADEEARDGKEQEAAAPETAAAPPGDEAAAAPAAAAADGGAGAWEAAFDAASARWYYWDAATGERTWDPPPSWVATDGDGGEEAAAAVPEQGYCYVDAHNVAQGPFPAAQLRAWCGALPMDLPVWRAAAAPAPGAPLDLDALDTRPLADVLGDAELLAGWRREQPELAAGRCAAPPAPVREAELRGDTAGALAAAALAGLPPGCAEARALRAAADAGAPLTAVAASWGDGREYEATALHVAGRGRVQAATGAREGVYSEYGKWLDADRLGEQLAAAAERRKRPLAGTELRAAKARRREAKAAKQRAWLAD
jgi:hypothetical protein